MDLRKPSSLAAAVLAAVALAAIPSAAAQPQSGSGLGGAPGDLLNVPRGKSTVIGGTISRVDPVMDEMTLKIFGGGKPMKIFYDERTQVYRDGVKMSLKDLHTNEHASVETMQDGTTVFARSVHMLSKAPEGECRGQVVSYDPGSGDLAVSNTLSRDLIHLRVPAGTAIVREGQAAATSAQASHGDLMKGALIRASFTSDNKGAGIASRIAILAMPGSEISFSGNVTFLDLRSHQFAIQDAQDGQSYKIAFDPAALPTAKDLHEGSSVKVTAEFDGTHYIARSIDMR